MALFPYDINNHMIGVLLHDEGQTDDGRTYRRTTFPTDTYNVLLTLPKCPRSRTTSTTTWSACSWTTTAALEKLMIPAASSFAWITISANRLDGDDKEVDASSSEKLSKGESLKLLNHSLGLQFRRIDSMEMTRTWWHWVLKVRQRNMLDWSYFVLQDSRHVIVRYDHNFGVTIRFDEVVALSSE